MGEESDLRRIFEALPGLYLAMTRDLVCVAVTDSLAAELAKSREEIIDRPLPDVLPDLATRNWRASIEHVLATKEAHAMGLTRTEEGRYWKSTNLPVIDDRGEVAYILHHTVEVTARAPFLSLFDDAPAAVALLTGEDLIIQNANAAILRMWGRTSEVIGMPLRDALPEVVAQGFVDLLLGVLHTGVPFRADQRLVRLQRGGDFGDFYFDFIYVPSREPTGAITGVFVFAYEVTDLVVARAEAQAANRLKDEFLTTLSHELRTPLTSVLGWSALLNDHPDDLEMRKQGLTTILSNARAQARIVDDVLDVSRIISGKMTLSLEPVDIHAIVGAAVGVVSPAAHAKEIALNAAIGPAIGPISADPDRLRQILWNLLSNAVKFTPPGGSITITAEREASFVRIAVRDTGIGIAPENLERVFERFRQLEGGTTRTRGGLGLGLAIARHLAELHGGTVTVSSEGVERGSVFTVLLPIRTAAATPTRSRPGLPSVRRAAKPLGGIRVLVVEDEEDARELVRVALEVAGATVVTAPSAEAGMTVVASAVPDVLISDIGMENEDGYSFVRRAHALAPQLPAIALTAYARKEDRDAVFAAGYQEFLAKPVEPDLLIGTVRRLAQSGD